MVNIYCGAYNVATEHTQLTGLLQKVGGIVCMSASTLADMIVSAPEYITPNIRQDFPPSTTYLAVIGNVLHIVEVRVTDGFIVLEWNITTDQVVQEDAQAPHSQLVPVVTFVNDPFRGRVDSGA